MRLTAVSSMLRDVDLLSAKLGKVDGFGDTGDFLADLVKAKIVKDEPAAKADKEVADDGAKRAAEGDETRTTEEQATREGASP